MVRKFLLFHVCVCWLGSVAHGIVISDSWIGGVQLHGDESLVMTGGGADIIESWDESSIKIIDTWTYQDFVGGIGSIAMNDNSTLEFFDGDMLSLWIYENATATLSGGTIGSIRSHQRPLGGDYPPFYWDKHITIEYSGELPTVDENNLLTGLWADGSTFSIQLHDGTGVFHPAISNIEFVPEPTPVVLFGLGGLFLRKRKL